MNWTIPTTAASGTYRATVQLATNNVVFASAQNGFTVTAPVTAVNGQCGAANGAQLTVSPTSGLLCTTGTSSAVVAGSSNNWTWGCAGSNGGTTASCATAPRIIVNGQCGPTSGTVVTAPPTTGLCSSGTASAVSGGSSTATWQWSCNGSGGGTHTTCATTAATGIWKPALNSSWQWQLNGTLQIPAPRVTTFLGTASAPATVYDTDLFDTSAAQVNAIHAQGARAICYFSAGSYENWRPDAGSFPATIRGKSNGWAGENWLDIRQLNILRPIMAARLDLCKQKGFDAAEPDNMDGYANKTGFPLTAQDQINYNILIAQLAHERGLSVGLKNDGAQVDALLPYFDWALNEQCFQFNECAYLSKFVAAGKAAFQVEYSLAPANFCAKANSMNINAMRKGLDLDVARTPCR
ncbi:MAG: endo alpha-1,4 polygalactosaminidase [Bdellovibrionales bacterium]